MNLSLVIMYVFIILLLFLFAILSYIGINNWNKDRENVVIQSTNTCSLPLEELIQIDTKNDICCINNGHLTGAYYIEVPIANTLDVLKMSVISEPTYYINVCREFCDAGSTVNSDGTLQCSDETELTDPKTTNANECIALIKPIEIDGKPCKGSAMPVASLGINPYYAYQISTSNGFAQCETRGPCI